MSILSKVPAQEDEEMVANSQKSNANEWERYKVQNKCEMFVNV